MGLNLRCRYNVYRATVAVAVSEDTRVSDIRQGDGVEIGRPGVEVGLLARWRRTWARWRTPRRHQTPTWVTNVRPGTGGRHRAGRRP